MEVVKDLTCPICLEFFSHPIILPCSHVMCRQPCAENVFEGNFIRCPVCRDNCYVSGGISSLPRVITIESIIEKIRADRKKRTAADRTQRRDTKPDDLSSETVPDGWGFKTNLDELLSEIGSDRTSPDIFNTRSNAMPSGGMPSNSHHNDQPALAFNSPGAIISTPMSLSRTSPSDTRNSLVLDGVLGDSPRLRTPHNHTGRRSQHLLLSSRFPSSSSTSGSPVSISTSRDHSSSNCFAESYSPIQRNQANDGSSHERLLTSPVFHRNQNSQFPFLPESLSHSTSISQIRDHHLSNDALATPTAQASARLRNHKRQNSLSQIETPAISIATTTTNNNNSNAPMVNVSRIHQSTNPVAPGSTTGSNSIGHHHESSIASLQACSYSIFDLQNEYLALTSQIEIHTPREDTETESSPLTSKFPSLKSNQEQNQQTSHHAIETTGMDRSGLQLCVPYSGYLTRPNEREVVLGAVATSGISHSETTHLGLSVSGNLETNGEQKELIPRTNHFYTEMASEQGGNRTEFSNDDIPTSDRAIANDFKSQLEKLCQTQSQLVHHMSAYRTHAQREQRLLEHERQEINHECDSLVAEIENKRSHFLLQLGDGEKHGSSSLDDVTVAMETLLESSQHLTQFVAQMLESKPELLLSTASNMFDRLSRAVQECESCLQESVCSFPDLDSSSFHIDTRVQRSVIAELDYLNSPSPPIIDTHRCVRNTHIVALVLTPPPVSDVIDHYEVCYCSEEQKNLGIEERYYAKQSADVIVHDVTNGTFPVILIDNLCPSTHYYFCVCAVNRKGSSPYSDYVQCLTLGEQECVVPVPTIMENLCRPTSTCVQLACPSLVTVTAHQEVGHYLLQRREQGAFVWKGRELFHKDEEFLVTKLRPQTRYFFLVMAYNKRGECQLSTPCTFNTT